MLSSPSETHSIAATLLRSKEEDPESTETLDHEYTLAGRTIGRTSSPVNQIHTSNATVITRDDSVLADYTWFPHPGACFNAGRGCYEPATC